MQDQEIISLMYKAMEAEIGIEIETSNIPYFRERFYSVRMALREKGRNEFDGLTLRACPTSKEKLWIMKKQCRN